MDKSLASLPRQAKLHLTMQKLARLDRRWSARLALPEKAQEQLPFQYWATRAASHLGDSWVWWGLAYLLWQRNAPRSGSFRGHTQPGTLLTPGRVHVLSWWSVLLVASGLIMLVKQLVKRPRPGDDKLLYGRGPDQYSFPSGHAARMGVVAVWAWLYGLRAGGVAGLLALVVSWTRVRLGIHYLGDIGAGIFLGGVLALAGRYWYRALNDN